MTLVPVAMIVVALFAFTRIQAARYSRIFPPIGTFKTIDGHKMHYIDVPPAAKTSLPPAVFVHGASGNLRDQMLAFREKMAGSRRLIFIDRPGHGYSGRDPENGHDPSRQAEAIDKLLQELKIPEAVMVGHSFGGAIIAAFGVHFPERTRGLVFLAPATHPWPGGISWYYNIATIPLVGFLFTELLTLPAGMVQMKRGIEGVFAPDKPPEHYFQESGTELVLRPETFRNNAKDVACLHKSVSALSPRYREIKSPTVIITGDSDDVVLAHIHSEGLARDIAGAKLVWFKNMGHKPDFAATATAIEAINEVSI